MSNSIKSLKLNIEADHCSKFIAMVSPKASYEIVWHLNRLLELNFKKEEDYEVDGLGYVCHFKDELDTHESEIFVFQQTTTKGKLFPELKNIDYLMVEQNFDSNFALHSEMLKKNTFLDFYFELEATKLKSETLHSLRLI